MDDLARLQQLVDIGKATVFSLFYPNVSPTLKQEWLGSYESLYDQEQRFAKPARRFQEACGNLRRAIEASEEREIVQDGTDTGIDHQQIPTCLLKLQEFIDERVDLGDQSWLLGLEYSLEEPTVDKWCGTMNGSIWTSMQISACGSSLPEVCQKLWEIVEEASLG